jgi:hypothetical protein
MQELIEAVTEWGIKQMVRMEKGRGGQNTLGNLLDVQRKQHAVPVVRCGQEADIKASQTRC